MLTTHTGSLPRPDDLVQLLYDESADGTRKPEREVRVRDAVEAALREQVACGIDIVNDGEMGRLAYATYITERLAGYEDKVHVPRGPRPGDDDFPGYAEWSRRSQAGSFRVDRYACTGPVRYTGLDALQRDIERLQTAAAGAGARELFMTAASPGVISVFQPNRYYRTDEEYVWALAEAMKDEYEAICRAGLVLQLDCPDLTGMGVAHDPGRPPPDQQLRIEALNHATREIPAERMRMHLCWGNFEGPHHLDAPLRDVLPGVLRARPSAISFEGANPRHEHEWSVFEDIELPEGKTIIPGVLDTTTNYVEHPELVAQRLVRYATLVGRDRVIAGADCGFGTFAGTPVVHPAIVSAKLRSMVEGARLASKELWRA